MSRIIALLLAVALAVPARAQEPGTGGRPANDEVPVLVRWGKWVAALGFVGLTAAGAAEHARADDEFAGLRRFCLDIGPCTIGQDGRYTGIEAESRYDAVVQGDRNARALFIAGQVALAGAAALFVMELSKSKGTENIPYSGLTIAPYPTGLRVGWKLSFAAP